MCSGGKIRISQTYGDICPVTGKSVPNTCISRTTTTTIAVCIICTGTLDTIYNDITTTEGYRVAAKIVIASYDTFLCIK